MSADYYRLRKATPPYLLTFFTLLALCAISLITLSIIFRDKYSYETFRFDAVSGILIISICFLLVMEERGYQISWDSETVYMRPSGWSWRLGRKQVAAMRFSDMHELLSANNRSKGHEERYRPGSRINIVGICEPPGLYDNIITIRYDHFSRESIFEFMRFLKIRRPDLIPETWSRRIKNN